jgi:hypothetical protein
MRIIREMKQARRSEMRKRAYEMAQSGEHSNYVTISLDIENEFGEDAHFLFEHPFAKQEFNEICERAIRDRERQNAQ